MKNKHSVTLFHICRVFGRLKMDITYLTYLSSKFQKILNAFNISFKIFAQLAYFERAPPASRPKAGWLATRAEGPSGARSEFSSWFWNIFGCRNFVVIAKQSDAKVYILYTRDPKTLVNDILGWKSYVVTAKQSDARV